MSWIEKKDLPLSFSIQEIRLLGGVLFLRSVRKPSDQSIMKLSFPGKCALASVIGVTALAQILPWADSIREVLASSRGTGYVVDALFAHPRVFAMLGSQLLVVLGLYAAYFGLVLALGRSRREHARRWAESEPALLVMAWFSISWLVLRAHAHAFPHSIWSWRVEPLFAPAASGVVDPVLALFLAWRLWVVLSSWTRTAPRCRPSRREAILASVITGCVVGAIACRFASFPSAGAAVRGSHRNVVVIGLDSLRRGALLSASAEELPHLHSLRQRAFVNRNVVTPLARTFPAWVTILTGEHPRRSGARSNQAPQAGIDRAASVAFDFRRAGYRTIYATDETRFSHIGPEFGFDQVIGPQKGVTDFLLGQFGDLPLVNFFVQVPYAEYLLPALVGNRAFAQAYRPEAFVGRLARAIGRPDGRPTFIAVHLCSAHWPYFVAAADTPAGARGTSHDAPTTDAYQAMLQVLDRQLGELMETLTKQGVLDDSTLIVALADHGEGLPGDEPLSASVSETSSSEQDDVVLRQPAGGHGASLLDPSQWGVFVLFAGRSASGPISPGFSDQLASLEDVAPALRRLARVGGESAQKREPSSAPDTVLGHRSYVLMETGWRPRGLNIADPDARSALAVAESSFDVRPDGRMEINPTAYADAVADKDIGITDGKATLLVVRAGGRSALVSQDLDRRSAHVYPLAPGAMPLSAAPPLIGYACGEPEMRARIESWCTLVSQVNPESQAMTGKAR